MRYIFRARSLNSFACRCKRAIATTTAAIFLLGNTSANAECVSRDTASQAIIDYLTTHRASLNICFRGMSSGQFESKLEQISNSLQLISSGFSAAICDSPYYPPGTPDDEKVGGDIITATIDCDGHVEINNENND